MAQKFEVGKEYEAYQREYGTIKIVRRTEKTIWVVTNVGIEFFMRVKIDPNGDEYAVDSTVPKKWRDAFTYRPEYEVE